MQLNNYIHYFITVWDLLHPSPGIFPFTPKLVLLWWH